MNVTARILLPLVLVYLVWGTSYLAIRVGVQAVEPFLFCSARFAIAAPLMFCVALMRGEKLPRSGHEWLFLLGTAIVMQVLASGMTAWGQQWIPSGEAALIMSSSAFWIAWFGAVGSSGERVSKASWGCIFVGVCGLLLLIETGLPSASIYGYSAILLAALLWSAGSMLLRRYGSSTQTFMTAAIHLAVAAVLTGLISYAFEGPSQSVWNSQSVIALLYLALFNSFLAYAAYYWLVHAAAPVVLGTFAYVTPAIAVLCGAWFLDESLSAQQLWGALLILLSVFLLIYVLPRLFSAREASRHLGGKR